MDGLDENSSLVLLATNRADRLDPAIVRDGRVDRKMTVKRPTMEVATEIARIDFAKYPTTCAAHEIAVRELFDEERKIAEVLTTEGKTLYLRMSDIITGAMITNVARRSSSAAMRRDIAGKKGKPSGISTNDVIKAVNEVETEAKTVSCNAELIAFAKKHQIEVGRYAMVGQG
jgi:SpoVK/Ycf46/Vps4 family AAA+-type ATPase